MKEIDAYSHASPDPSHVPTWCMNRTHRDVAQQATANASSPDDDEELELLDLGESGLDEDVEIDSSDSDGSDGERETQATGPNIR